MSKRVTNRQCTHPRLMSTGNGSRVQSIQPGTDGGSISLDEQNGSSCPMDQYFAQIDDSITLAIIMPSVSTELLRLDCIELRV
jgi:hypothetical protein